MYKFFEFLNLSPRYAAKWYKFSPRLKALLIITLHRSLIPCNLTAGDIFSLSMATYAAVSNENFQFFIYDILKTIYAYICI